MLFISLTLSLMLVALIVLALKKHQQQRLDALAERDQSLPPLDMPQETSSVKTEQDAEVIATDAPDEVTEDTPGQVVKEAVKDWKVACKEHRQAQRYEQALACARDAWPRSQSFEQAALTIRAAIKQAQQTDSPDFDKWLSALYRIAAEYSLLFDKAPGEAEIRWQTIARSYSRDELRRITLPWEDIGVNQLRLLNKTDCKMMIQAWGEPRQHISAKTWHKRGANS